MTTPSPSPQPVPPASTPFTGSVGGPGYDNPGAAYTGGMLQNPYYSLPREFSLLHPQYGVDFNSLDNTAALQRWADDVSTGMGTGYVPRLPKLIRAKTLPLFGPPAGGNATNIRIVAEGCVDQNRNVQFVCTGDAGFRYQNIWHSDITGVGVLFPNGVAGVQAHEIQFTAQFNNSVQNRFAHCYVYMQGCTNCHGFRIGQYLDGSSNGCFTKWDQCLANDVDRTAGNVGYQVGGSDAFGNVFDGCNGTYLSQCLIDGPIATILTRNAMPGDTTLTVASTLLFPASGIVSINGIKIPYAGKTATAFTGCVINSPFAASAHVAQFVPGQGVYPGSGSIEWRNGGGSNNGTPDAGGDIYLAQNGHATFANARWENGYRHLQANQGGVGLCPHIEEIGGYLAGYGSPSDGRGVIWLTGLPTYLMRSMKVYSNPVPFSAAHPLITNIWGNGSFGSIAIEHSDLYATDPFVQDSAGWPLVLRGVQLTDRVGNVIGQVNRLADGAV